MPRKCTRDRILDAAEDLFAQLGVSGTSLRAVTQAADANLAAVHYHFGSKQGLLDAVVARRAEPLNAQRLRALSGIEAGDEEGRGRIEAIVIAFFLPGLDSLRDLPAGKSGFAKLLAGIEALPPAALEDVAARHFGDVSARFVRALAGALPHLPTDQVADRFRLATGLLVQLLAGRLDLDTIPGFPPGRVDDERRLRQAIAFVIAGLEAPALPTPIHTTRAADGDDASSERAKPAARKAASSC